MYRRIQQAIEILPKIVVLLSPSYYPLENLPTEELWKKKGFEGKAFLSVFLAESGNVEFGVDRAANLLLSMDMLYKACAMLQNETSPLVLIGCDSGSDKAFDFLGAAKVIQEIKEILIAVWDRSVFHREVRFEQRLQLVAKSLPIIDEINKLEKSKKLGKEQAEILRTQILNSLNGFMNSGAYTPEMQNNSVFSPREIMTPTVKLLKVGEADSPTSTKEKR